MRMADRSENDCRLTGQCLSTGLSMVVGRKIKVSRQEGAYWQADQGVWADRFA